MDRGGVSSPKAEGRQEISIGGPKRTCALPEHDVPERTAIEISCEAPRIGRVGLREGSVARGGSGRGARTWLAPLALASSATALIALSCIIPDTDIQVFSLDSNASAVRFVEGIPLAADARCACNPNTCECPLADSPNLPPFLDPTRAEFQFCSCGENQIDDGRLAGVQFYAEDQDELDGQATDDLYAVALLDWDPSAGFSAFEYVAYRGYLDPRQPLDSHFSSYEDPIKRPRPYTRAINLVGSDGTFDLCNGAGKTIEPGYHTLTLMVTDQSWYQTPGGFPDTTSTDSTGTDTGDEESTSEGPLPEPPPVVYEGVPNIAEGATYDTVSYVFHCFAEGGPECRCKDIEQPP
jgi:hypothetical protein